jgi:hypothetical protein
MLRWEEEVKLVGYEMVWTVRYFVYNKEVWEGRKGGEHQGPASYAARKAAMWSSIANDADQAFSIVNKSYSRQFDS